MKFTGERYIPLEKGKIRLEHYHRYAIVKDIVRNKDILDLACGEGYGSNFMAQFARTVVGVDISEGAILHARSEYSDKPNLTFRQDNAINTGLPDASFDVVVSYETIEHLSEQSEMLAEIRRVLRPDGVLVVSSPNRPIYSEESGEDNEFHVKELDYSEFSQLLSTYFPAVQFYGQRIVMGSIVQPLEGGESVFRVWHDNEKNLKPYSAPLVDPVYFVAVCGERQTSLPNIDSSVVYPGNLDLVKHYEGFAKWAKTLDRQVAERDREIYKLKNTVAERDEKVASINKIVTRQEEQNVELRKANAEWGEKMTKYNEMIEKHENQITDLKLRIVEREQQIANLKHTVARQDEQIVRINETLAESDTKLVSLNEALAERDNQISELTEETVKRGEWALGLDQQLNEARALIKQFTSSKSWRISRPLRESKRLLTNFSEKIMRFKIAVAKRAKAIYLRLPLSHNTKMAHKRFLTKYFPGLLLRSRGLSYTDPVTTKPAKIKATLINNNHIGASTLNLKTSSQPIVSIVIPIYGQCEYTLRCLSSIAANSPLTPYEVIVVDDHSPDDSAEILKGVKGIRLVSNAENQGFIRSCNVGAKAAMGQYLHFLNNDTEVTPGWLDELFMTFHELPGTGIVGSKLLYPNGTLQEAGGIIWQDGSAWNFGRNQDPSLPMYNYAREVDYCSGASIMVQKELFDELGGFDECYVPAYGEDSDLALKIRDSGRRVIYQPLSVVVHFEGVTSGTDTSQGTKAYQIENARKLFERWKGRLKGHQLPGHDVDNAKDRMANHRVLVLDNCTPTPNQDAGSVTVLNLLLLLREMKFQVTFIPVDNFLYMPDYTTELQRVGIEVIYAPYCTSVVQHLKEHGSRYHLTFLFRPAVIDQHLESIRRYCPQAKVLYHTVDLHFLRMSREAELQNDVKKRKAADEMKQLEYSAIQVADASIVHSTIELELLRKEMPEQKIHVFPLITDIRGTNIKIKERKDIAFVGGYQHTPNVDAVQYFVKEIMPILRCNLPGVRFYVVGSNPPPELNSLACEDVLVKGFVEDLSGMLDHVRVSVAPLRYGAGIKGKIGTAMAVGLPTVATTLAAEGMSLSNGENIIIADSTEEFANEVVRLYNDENLWNKLSTTGLDFAEKYWGAEAALALLDNILCDIEIASERSNYELRLYSPNSQEKHQIKKKDNGSFIKNESTVDNRDDYNRKIQQELEIYAQQTNVHDLPEIFHYWSNKYITPIFQEAGFDSIDEFFIDNLTSVIGRTQSPTPRIVSIGSGNCDLEVRVAKAMPERGCDNFIFECLELNPEMLNRGRVMAEEQGVFQYMRFNEVDFNVWKPTAIYDGVIANQSLHHVTQLEHLFDEVKNCLHSNGAFVISDTIGRNGHQRWPESLKIVNQFWQELPEKYRFNVLLNRYEEEYENWDCSSEGFEGIRAQDILPLLLQRFQCEKFIGFGSAIDIFVDRCFGHHFDAKNEWDRNFIDRVHEEDERGLISGQLTPTHMLAVWVKHAVEKPYYSREMQPIKCVRVES